MLGQGRSRLLDRHLVIEERLVRLTTVVMAVKPGGVERPSGFFHGKIFSIIMASAPRKGPRTHKEMTQVRVNSTSSTKWPIALAIVAALAGAAYLWHLSSAPPSPATPPATAQNPNAPAAPAAPETEAGHAAAALSSASEAEFAAIVNEQQAVNQKIAKNPVLEPIVGPVTHQPAFLSDTEWAILTAAAQQQTSPEKALTSLVNAARFNKQLEQWESLSKTAATAAAAADSRQALANQLLDDLPQHVLDGNMDLPAALTLQGSLIVDVVQNPSERKRRAAAEAKRLVLPPPDATAEKH
jgi:hypothetical protein